MSELDLYSLERTLKIASHQLKDIKCGLENAMPLVLACFDIVDRLNARNHAKEASLEKNKVAKELLVGWGSRG